MSADLYFTMDSSFFVLFRQLHFALAERNWTKSSHMLRGECNLKMRVQNVGYPSRYKSGAQKPPFLDDCDSMATSMTYIFGTKHDIHKGQVHWQLRGVSYIVSKRHELWSTNGFKLEVNFYPPSVNSAFHFIARLRRRRSANRTQPHFANGGR